MRMEHSNTCISIWGGMQENPIAKYFLGYSWPLMKNKMHACIPSGGGGGRTTDNWPHLLTFRFMEPTRHVEPAGSLRPEVQFRWSVAGKKLEIMDWMDVLVVGQVRWYGRSYPLPADQSMMCKELRKGSKTSLRAISNSTYEIQSI